MKTPKVLPALLALVLTATARAESIRFPTQTLTVPDGFEISLVAGPPLVDRPIEADFDELGRLYVTDSSGSNAKPDVQLKERPHRVLRLEDADGDGTLDKRTVFADKMMFPEGCMWLDGSLYVAAPPSIWKLTDSDGDGVADQRVEWFQGKTLTGCANDLHGPYRGPDGWIYWAKGAFAEQTYERPGKKPFVTRAAHLFRARPGNTATDIEPVMTGGMDNPVEVAFTASGERIFTTTFLQNPEGGRRDGLIHAVYGGVYGKAHDVVDGHPRTGELMPVMTHLGPAAPCGLTRYESGTFGEEYRDNFFACLFNLHKVTRHVLDPDGATFRTRDSDFVTSDSTDFHPTDVLEDSDGSLLVIDTGGWYKLCCPTSQLSKPDVLGAIYRVRRKGAAVPAAAARKHDRESLASLKDIVSSASTPAARRSAVWALTRVGGEGVDAAIRSALLDPDEGVRVSAIHSVSVRRDRAAESTLEALLADGSAHVQRAAAEALGRLGSQQAVPYLLAAASKPHDRVLEHSLIYALIEIGDTVATSSGLSSKSALERRAALIALDQMEGGELKADSVTPLLSSAEPGLRETATWIVSHHPEWGGALAGFLRDRIQANDLSDASRAELETQLAQFASDSAVQELLAATVRDTKTLKASRLTALRAMAHAGVKETPAAWVAEIARALGDEDADVACQAVSAARGLKPRKEGSPHLAAALLLVAHDASKPADARLDALAAVPGGLTAVEPDSFAFLLASLDPAGSVRTRATASSVLSKASLSSEQLLSLADAMKSAGPLEVPRLLPAFEKAGDETLGRKLIAALEQSPAASSLRGDTVKTVLAKYPSPIQKQGEELIARLNVDAGKQKAHLDELAATLGSGDVRRGQAVFNSQKAACSVCHAIGYLGGKIGPDLTTIGTIRTERDLLESIVYPSTSFVRSYEPLEVVTTTGQVHNGIVKRDAADEILLVTGPQTEVTVSRNEIAEMRPGSVSVMPGGLDQQISRQELADLLAFLKATKWGS